MTARMKAVVIHEAGGPDVLKIEERPVPQPAPGWVLIQVKAFGLNRSEMFTRQGHSPTVEFPRIMGIEAVGIVEAAPGGEFDPGATVATAMGGMGRDFDGGYAEYACVPANQVQQLKTKLDWAVLGAMPEMIQTAWGALHSALHIEPGHTLLIRGGTTSVGLAAATLAKKHGVTVAATTRRPEREALLRGCGADHIIIETGSISEEVKVIFEGGVDRVLELVGTTTLVDSLHSTKRGGSVCMAGMVGGEWEIENFSPMAAIPNRVSLTTYGGRADDFLRTPLQDYIDEIESGRAEPIGGPVFTLDEIVEAHRCMEEDRAGGKIVVVT